VKVTKRGKQGQVGEKSSIPKKEGPMRKGWKNSDRREKSVLIVRRKGQMGGKKASSSVKGSKS